MNDDCYIVQVVLTYELVVRVVVLILAKWTRESRTKRRHPAVQRKQLVYGGGYMLCIRVGRLFAENAAAR